MFRESTETSAPSPVESEIDRETLRKRVEFDTLREVLRRPSAGEQQAQGIMTRIECRQKDVLLIFQIGDGVLKLTSTKFEEVDFTTYTSDASGEISCGPRQRSNPVVVIYRSAPNARNQTDGEVISGSLVPKEFQLSKN
ncbi:MAG: hypothetical protein WKF84_00260 [Pyrinomonadaceae bacterium]